MSYVFFEDILEEQGHKLTYDAVVNYAGNSFCEKSWDMITEHNPMNIDSKQPAGAGFASFFSGANIKLGKPKINGGGEQ